MARRDIRFLYGEHFFEEDLPLYINRAVENYDLHEHRHDFLEISYVSEGSGVHHTDQPPVSVSQGDLVVIPLGVSHVFRPVSPSRSRPLIVRNCLIRTERFGELLAGIPGCGELTSLLEQPEIRYYRDADGDCGRLFERLHHEYSGRRPAREAALYVLLLELLIRLHRFAAEKREPASAKLPSGMDEALRLIHAGYASPISTAALAASAGVGERQFQRLFARYTGMTPLNYLQAVRINEACRLLRDTDMKVAAVAAAVGYQDLAHFTALFKRVAGLAPGGYRRRRSTGAE
ncbi:AraC family transcriptional regulator [Cohnella sp. JJ-181]|uniref:AraC family transcriptional regulator n=1 Tax=Cohnella rhizoplanae TaxID=2974897 RepID=UPI0022FFB543|nr:AraC family transcriptional regulator [Cohnella sp. JJ-181]CAI6014642.1 HTH-type transcriptional activator RhaR [Cohnella sp. JJ-181]